MYVYIYIMYVYLVDDPTTNNITVHLISNL